MLRYFLTTAFLVLYLTKSFSNSRSIPVDSIGIEKKNGKTFVLHKVAPGETLYSILKRYNSTEKEFYAANPDFKKDAVIGNNQVISVPIKVKSKSVPRPRAAEVQQPASDTTRPRGVLDENGIEVVDIPEATPKDAPLVTKKEDSVTTAVAEKVKEPKLKTHTVVAGDKLFGIATKYSVKVWQLREWNSLTSDVLRPNQILVVEKPANLVASATKEEKKETAKPKVTVNPAVTAPKTKPVGGPAGDLDKTAVVTKPLANKPQTPVPNAPTGKKYSEQGIAEVIDAGSATNKYLALHRTAPVGTLIKIANEANGQSVWVKVIGKLTGSGDVIIKISPKAFEKLQPKDKRIRASLSYAL